ncbi:hypothetical protein BT93_L2794 [Corymbia citriodora subsp. variegata]|uniref:Uncharacterized protein n=1 Tax=Corymbia citriodora subsp. variegata TaxID=360336 RepID=A0A8T0CJ08_CORYI|nr:hypothetical protein BT93_L2794 [Corymbia citriodora subsp. variegata]
MRARVVANARFLPSDYSKSFISFHRNRNVHVILELLSQFMKNNHFSSSFMFVHGIQASLANAARETVVDPRTAQPFFNTNSEPMGFNW